METNITKHLQVFSDEVDSSSHAIVHTAYLESEEHDILDTYRQLENLQRDVERIVGSVSDLTSAQSPSTYHLLESKEDSIRVMSKLSRQMTGYSTSFRRDNEQMENSLHEIKVLMDKVTKQTVKQETNHSFQVQLPFITSLVAEAIGQAPFERMLLTQEERDRQAILASRNSREGRQTIGLGKYEKATFADSQLEGKIIRELLPIQEFMNALLKSAENFYCSFIEYFDREIDFSYELNKIKTIQEQIN